MLGFKTLKTSEGFTTPLGDDEIARLIITEHGKKVFKQSALGGLVVGVGLLFTLNRFGSKTLRAEAATAAAKAAQAVDPNGGNR